MIHGSGTPFSASVRMIVAAARKTTSSRSGNGAPEVVRSGTESAAASVMEPRTAAQPTRNMRLGSGPDSAPAHPQLSRKRTWAEAHTQPSRSTISNAHNEKA